MIPAKTTAQRQAALRARRKAEDLTEVRGIYLPPALHKQAKEKLMKTTEKMVLDAARLLEAAATLEHASAELLGSGPAYTAAFDRMAQARADLQAAEAAFDAAQDVTTPHP